MRPDLPVARLSHARTTIVMTEAERVAYHTGLYNLPGNVPGRLWPTVGEKLWWERGNRERLAAEQRGQRPGGSTSGGGLDLEQVETGIGGLLGLAGAFFTFFTAVGLLDGAGAGTLVMLGGAALAAVVAFVIALVVTHLVFSALARLFEALFSRLRG